MISFYLCAISGAAQEKTAGPIITNYGKVFTIDNPEFKTDTSLVFKAVFDVMQTSDNNEHLNTSLETAARFLNMHAQAGVPPENLHVALVVHNLATKDIISHEAYQKRFGINNPNAELIEDLLAVGGKVIVCGQSIHSRGFKKEELLPGVQVSLSAITALLQLQNDDYKLIKF
jgi:intracellular sulfur oxidation DsrE/DsrF family protein